MKIIKIILLVMFFSLNVQAEEQYKKFTVGTVVFTKQNYTIDVEVATTKIQRAIGLMYRKHLASNKGMLFVFEEEGIQRVWMKHTFIPLDIIFISADHDIVSIIKNLQPCMKASCTIYDSKQKAKYMLELNAGVTTNRAINVAEKIRISQSY